MTCKLTLCRLFAAPRQTQYPTWPFHAVACILSWQNKWAVRPWGQLAIGMFTPAWGAASKSSLHSADSARSCHQVLVALSVIMLRAPTSLSVRENTHTHTHTRTHTHTHTVRTRSLRRLRPQSSWELENGWPTKVRTNTK